LALLVVDLIMDMVVEIGVMAMIAGEMERRREMMIMVGMGIKVKEMAKMGIMEMIMIGIMIGMIIREMVMMERIRDMDIEEMIMMIEMEEMIIMIAVPVLKVAVNV